jgi:hypothetical protein
VVRDYCAHHSLRFVPTGCNLTCRLTIEALGRFTRIKPSCYKCQDFLIVDITHFVFKRGGRVLDSELKLLRFPLESLRRLVGQYNISD